MRVCVTTGHKSREQDMSGRLSRVPEETKIADDDEDGHASFVRLCYQHEDTELQKILDKVLINEAWTPEGRNHSPLKRVYS